MRSVLRSRLSHWSALALVLLLFGLTAAGCQRSAPGIGQWFAGKSLLISPVEVQRVPQITYLNDDGKYYTLRPQDPANELVATHLDVRNLDATVVLYTVDEQAIRLDDSASPPNQYRPLNPLEQREETSEVSREPERFLPFIWGSDEIYQNEQLLGWLVFEVPKGAELRRLVWYSGDTVHVWFRR
ncbi:MAG: hypothetical protein ACE5IG_02330 [Dehalococcoidia bacterium]